MPAGFFTPAPVFLKKGKEREVYGINDSYSGMQLIGQMKSVSDILARSFIITSLQQGLGPNWGQILVQRITSNPQKNGGGDLVYKVKPKKLTEYSDMDISLCTSIYYDPAFDQVLKPIRISHELLGLKDYRNRFAHFSGQESDINLNELLAYTGQQKKFLDR